MIVVLAIDALEEELVSRFGCVNLQQKDSGRTDISEFSQPRTIVLWSSFLTGKNKEREVLALGNKEMWNVRWDKEETFLRFFGRPAVIDLPSFSYDLKQHGRERRLLREFFDSRDAGKKEKIRLEYNELSFRHHRSTKERFGAAMKEGNDLVIGYFSVADVIGHLNFGNTTMMKMIYKDLDDIAREVRSVPSNRVIVLSDHGMKAVGPFGDHSDHGFWSTNTGEVHGTPRITEFFGIIKGMSEVD
jgi:hypothetical protein